MSSKWFLGLGGMVVASSLVACMVTGDESVAGSRGAASSAAEFNKNNLVSDTAMRDKRAMTAAEIQEFLENTPYNKKSVLADYTEGGKTAAQIISEVSTAHNINPLELLVRAQMETGLMNKTTAPDNVLEIAFGCGCPHAPICTTDPDRFTGFANQAECAAGTLDRAMTRATTAQGTVSGWKRGTAKTTEDRVSVTPSNAATAALYTYTPWAGEAGGGRRGVGGNALHFQIWNSFADAVGYGAQRPASATADAGTQADSGAKSEPEEPTTTDAGQPEPEPEPRADAGKGDPEPEPEPEPETTADAGAGKAGEGSDGTSGAEDSDIIGEGTAPPTTNAPPPRGSSSARSSDDGDYGSEEEATDAELATKKKSSDGCSTSGGTRGAGDASVIGLALAAAIVAGKRRRR